MLKRQNVTNVPCYNVTNKASNSFRTLYKCFKTVFCKASEKLLEYRKTFLWQVSQTKFDIQYDIHLFVCWFYHLM
jgi:hypothetical protein